jgi:hypothetical protein
LAVSIHRILRIVCVTLIVQVGSLKIA